jgi:lipopolysaccharide transport protein LptA
VIIWCCKTGPWLKPGAVAAVLIVMCLFIGMPVQAEPATGPGHAQQAPPAVPAKPAAEPPAVPAKPAAEPSEVKADKPGAEKISIVSDQATINRANRTIELTGNVQVHQGDTLITSDSLLLYLKEGAKLDAPGSQSENAIERIIANGNVTFKLDIGTAYSDHADYTTRTRLLVLTGKSPKFISRDNTITGSRITVNRDTGMVTFDGGKGRVEAVIYSKDRL